MPGPMLEPSLPGTASCRQRTGWQLLGELEAVDLRQCRIGWGRGGGPSAGRLAASGNHGDITAPRHWPCLPRGPQRDGLHVHQMQPAEPTLLAPTSWTARKVRLLKALSMMPALWGQAPRGGSGSWLVCPLRAREGSQEQRLAILRLQGDSG